MEDRLLSRGKRVDNGEWIEGYYVYCRKHHYILPSDINGFDERWYDWIEVIPEIVGRCTGLRDKNGKLIFEGDILSDAVGDIFTTFYNTAHCAYLAEYIKVECKDKKRGYWRLGEQCSLQIEIIGNIFDNKELFEVEE